MSWSRSVDVLGMCDWWYAQRCVRVGPSCFWSRFLRLRLALILSKFHHNFFGRLGTKIQRVRNAYIIAYDRVTNRKNSVSYYYRRSRVISRKPPMEKKTQSRLVQKSVKENERNAVSFTIIPHPFFKLSRIIQSRIETANDWYPLKVNDPVKDPCNWYGKKNTKCLAWWAVLDGPDQFNHSASRACMAADPPDFFWCTVTSTKTESHGIIGCFVVNSGCRFFSCANVKWGNPTRNALLYNVSKHAY